MRVLGISAFLFSLVSLTVGQDKSLTTVEEAFTTANIPADANLEFKPTVLLEVVFPQVSAPPVNLHAGIQLPRNATVGPPIFGLRGVRRLTDAPFVVAMVDLDAPTPQDPSEAQIRHFLGGDFSTTLQDGAVHLSNSTPAISNFLQPTPPAGSDPHRYVFLLFDQPRGFDRQTFVNSTTSVANFSISEFAAEVGLGAPIGGTFMLVGPDASST